VDRFHQRGETATDAAITLLRTSGACATGDYWDLTMGSTRLTYSPRPDATPESELDALAAVYAFVLKCQEQTAAEQSGRDDAEGDKHDRATRIIQKD
jgi:hypothetical protein